MSICDSARKSSKTEVLGDDDSFSGIAELRALECSLSLISEGVVHKILKRKRRVRGLPSRLGAE